MNTILIVDDNEAVRVAVENVLASEGFRVLTAINGLKGLETLARADVDLIVLDLQMPVMGGAAFRSAQLIDPRIKDIPVILMSGEPDLQSLAKAFSIDHVLPKSAIAVKLVPLVRQILKEG